jgi:biopolymer transport protein ExbD
MSFRLSQPSLPARRVSLTPLIDVVFILLVFFMLETTFLREGGITVAGAQSEGGSPSTRQLSIELFDASTVWVNGRRFTGTEWLAALPDAAQVDQVELRTAASVPVGRLVEVLDELAEQGHQGVSIGRVREFSR